MHETDKSEDETDHQGPRFSAVKRIECRRIFVFAAEFCGGRMPQKLENLLFYCGKLHNIHIIINSGSFNKIFDSLL